MRSLRQRHTYPKPPRLGLVAAVQLAHAATALLVVAAFVLRMDQPVAVAVGVALQKQIDQLVAVVSVYSG